MTITASQIQSASQALRAVLRFDYPADAVLSRYFRDLRELGARDRAFVAEAVYGVLRRKRMLERLCGPEVSPRQLVLAWLARVEGLTLRQLGEGLHGRDTDFFTAIKGRELPEGSLAETTDLPEWLAERLLATRTPEQVQALAQSLNRPAPLDLRVNPLKLDRDALIEKLRADGIACAAAPLSPLAVRLEGKPALQKHPLFLDGSFEVQDEGSQLLGFLVQPKRGEMVVDFCAGAGGKTLLLGALMRNSGRLYAFDVSDKRLAKLKPRVARSGLSNVHPVVIASENDPRVKRLAGKIDRVLVDAPCSGLGTLRRNPDLKWRQSPESVAELTAKQAAILASASRLVKAGGRLVYATCSLLPEENEAIVAAFLAAHPGFVQVSAGEILGKQGITVGDAEQLHLSPAEHDTDGFFAAVLERSAG
ncbi:MAG TPA: RsmB/NOP family class I SAM-dependent RNA methyltransferase [Rhodocyclaceae bacterium]|nr:RsmB/NOP family class I SAM-dependent RNA methyltransferase [Rhodocyclaceae bacterium]HMV64653.1 RsmB/NOP family class I SAM-dependent RNA methyltransferase [Rhodocyclaceae bacterium]HNA68993.1 RsmB/NOP family class I SAM-dependent RNA methyltransferase [Rhodocyclaceae bacterium]HNE15718.1 RsmB/NOP family class I SAM-dependent RNA methyltransferase [Rhodocyclaceae bacterium]